MGLLLEGGWVAVLGLRQRGVGGLLERLPRDGLRQLQRALLHRSLAKPLARSLAPSLSLTLSVGWARVTNHTRVTGITNVVFKAPERDNSSDRNDLRSGMSRLSRSYEYYLNWYLECCD